MWEMFHSKRDIICITGWSLWVKLQLLRGADLAVDSRTLGDILVEKANSGTQVKQQIS